MACATLKRTLDWEAINQRPSKRRRCIPFDDSKNSGPSTSRSAANIAGASCSHDNLVSLSPKTPSNRYSMSSQPSPFSDVKMSKMSPDKMAIELRDEIKRLHRRKQIPISSAALERMQDSESSGSEMGPDSPHRPDSPPNLIRNPEKALFTFKQVQLICQRMLKEREDELREKYDDVLTNKLAEQYDAFVKFTYDQIQRRYDAAPSYLS